jgi:NTE family protein
MAKTINLALQGGGAHGAFTWGVLDRLLEEEDIDITAVSGTSAGAINAVVLAEGLLEGGRPAARARLDAFWREVAKAGQTSPFQRMPFDSNSGRYDLTLSPAYLFGMAIMRTFSPYQFNPQNANPLRDLLNRFIKFDLVRKQKQLKLFINTTHVSTGGLRVFREHELTTDVVLASTTLPVLFQTPLIDGEGYWDGGYIANPALEPMVRNTDTRDILIVQLNPIVRDDIPRTPHDIGDRLGEIVFNASLVTELRFIAERNRLVANGELSAERHPFVRLHMVHGHSRLAHYDGSSRVLAEEQFLRELKAHGRHEAEHFLRHHKDDVGARSSFDYELLVDHLTQHHHAAPDTEAVRHAGRRVPATA